MERTVDRMAWAGMMELVPELRARQAKVACLGADRVQLVQRLANAEQTGQRRYAQLKAKLERAVQRLANAREKERRRHEQLKTVYASFSWRITRPLRAIKRTFFR